MVKFRPIERSLETLDRLWPWVEKWQRWTMDDLHNQKTQLAEKLANPDNLYWDILEGDRIVGYASAHRDTPWSMVAHILFFDGRMRGREEQTVKLIEWTIKNYHLDLVRTMIPADHCTTAAFLKRMGWEEDGVIHAAVQRNGRREPMVLYSYVAGGYDNGRHTRRRQPNGQADLHQHAPASEPGPANSHRPNADGEHVSGWWETSDVW